MTIPKNTNKAHGIIARATGIKVYSLSNSFSGQDMRMDSPQAYLAEMLKRESAKLVSPRSGKYTLEMHSNLWYEFSSDEIPVVVPKGQSQ